MKYLHQHEDFKFFINKAAKEVNLSEFIIEKDYWVTYLLKNLHKYNDLFNFYRFFCVFMHSISYKRKFCFASNNRNKH